MTIVDVFWYVFWAAMLLDVLPAIIRKEYRLWRKRVQARQKRYQNTSINRKKYAR